MCDSTVASLAQVGFKDIFGLVDAIRTDGVVLGYQDLAFSSLYSSFNALFNDNTFPEQITEGTYKNDTRVELGGGSGFGYQVFCLKGAVWDMIATEGGGSGGGLEGGLKFGGSRSVGGGGGGGVQWTENGNWRSAGGGGGCGIYDRDGLIDGVACGGDLDEGADYMTKGGPMDAVANCLEDGKSQGVALSGGGGGGGGAAECCGGGGGYGFSFHSVLLKDGEPNYPFNPENVTRYLLSDAQKNQFKYDVTGYALYNASLICGGYKDWTCVCTLAKDALSKDDDRNWLQHADCSTGGQGQDKKKEDKSGKVDIDFHKSHHYSRDTDEESYPTRCRLFRESGCPAYGLALTNCPEDHEELEDDDYALDYKTYGVEDGVEDEVEGKARDYQSISVGAASPVPIEKGDKGGSGVFVGIGLSVLAVGTYVFRNRSSPPKVQPKYPIPQGSSYGAIDPVSI